MSEWISVEDEVPPYGLCVDIWASLIGGYNQGDEFREENCFYDQGISSWWKWDDECGDKLILNSIHVTHWMPLPEPPK